MDAKFLVSELARFGEDQMRVLGKKAGGRYVARCIETWRQAYGDQVADAVREKLKAAWHENSRTP